MSTEFQKWGYWCAKEYRKNIFWKTIDPWGEQLWRCLMGAGGHILTWRESEYNWAGHESGDKMGWPRPGISLAARTQHWPLIGRWPAPYLATGHKWLQSGPGPGTRVLPNILEMVTRPGYFDVKCHDYGDILSIVHPFSAQFSQILVIDIDDWCWWLMSWICRPGCWWSRGRERSWCERVATW